MVRDAEGGGGLPVRRHSYRGHRVELWRIAEWEKTTKKNSRKSSRVDNSGVPGLYPAKAGTTRFGPMAGLAVCVFLLDFSITCFWPQTDKVHLFLAAALF